MHKICTAVSRTNFIVCHITIFVNTCLITIITIKYTSTNLFCHNSIAVSSSWLLQTKQRLHTHCCHDPNVFLMEEVMGKLAWTWTYAHISKIKNLPRVVSPKGTRFVFINFFLWCTIWEKLGGTDRLWWLYKDECTHAWTPACMQTHTQGVSLLLLYAIFYRMDSHIKISRKSSYNYVF